MSNAQRPLLLVGVVVVLGGALILLSPGDDSDDGAATTSVPAATTDAPATTTAATTPAQPAPAPQPGATTIVVTGGKPVGGVQEIKATKDDVVRIEVTSEDTSSEVHLHGYDIKRDLSAGGSASFSFTAKNEGIFEMELEDTATQIAKIVIEP